jgi:hypothetical protein
MFLPPTIIENVHNPDSDFTKDQDADSDGKILNCRCHGSLLPLRDVAGNGERRISTE